jgi:ribonucleoside-diphosphate reductase alpha chain
MPEDERFGGETSAKQVFDRLAGAWAYWGWKGGYFTTEEDARAYFDEMRYMLARQMAAPNSPQWFNTGLHWAYGIDGPSQGHYYVDYKTGKLTKSSLGLRAPAAPCLLHPVGRRRPGGRRRHHGSVGARGAAVQVRLGHRHQLLLLRGEGEPLSGGGKSSGLMGFLKIGDRAAGAIKSGGTTRRAAKMVIVDADHPDIEEFINWKVKEEQKVASLVAGSKMHERISTASSPRSAPGTATSRMRHRPEEERALKTAIRAAKRSRSRDLRQARARLRAQGYTSIEFPTYDTDWDSRPIPRSPARTPTTPSA